MEYKSYTVLHLNSDLHVTINWGSNHRTVDVATLKVEPMPDLSNHPCLDACANPFYLDSGVTTHISLDRNDFYDLRPINPHAVRGVGGSTIDAIGVGSVRLLIAKRAHILLSNVLYIPMATVHLISISSLCHLSQFIAHFAPLS